MSFGAWDIYALCALKSQVLVATPPENQVQEPSLANNEFQQTITPKNQNR